MKVAIYCKRVPDEAVVSVLTLVNELLSKNVQLYMNAAFSEFLKSKNINLEKEYPQGGLSLIYNDKNVFEKINF